MRRALWMATALSILVTGLVPVQSVSALEATPTAQTADQICASDSGTPVVPIQSTPSTGIDPASLDFDLIYLEAMIPHHETAILLATVVLERSDRPELRDLASAIVETQSVELAVMQGWRNEWYSDIPALSESQLIDAMNAKLADSPGVGGVAGLEDMGVEHAQHAIDEVCDAGDDLDIVFIDVLVPHHASAIMLSQKAIDMAIHREIKDLADSVIAAQQFDIDQLLAWREAWFPGTPIADDHG